ncbi:hypothetical protein V6N12_002028 [Hibiscus sabdariffa]|uniref:C3H1-type domain-containing protein n=1 Tax=Hibiscus sabdariffa TaxID=183260 RepID=A0ABR2B5Y7_9ROSI
MTKPRTSFDGGSKSSLPGTRSSLMKDFGDFAELDTDISFVSSDKPNTDRNSSLMFDSFVDCNRNSRFSTSTDPIKEINSSQSASLGLDHNISPANYNLNRSKRQTKLCVLYQRGHCSRQSCSFAHGDADLRGFSGSHGGKRKYRNGDLRDKLDRRLSPERRYSPNRDARDQQTLRGHSPLRSIDKRR